MRGKLLWVKRFGSLALCATVKSLQIVLPPSEVSGSKYACPLNQVIVIEMLKRQGLSVFQSNMHCSFTSVKDVINHFLFIM